MKGKIKWVLWTTVVLSAILISGKVAGLKKQPSFACVGAKSSDFECYENYYKSLVKGESIAAAFSDLKARYEANGYIKAMCHPIVHVIGHEAAEKYTEVAEAYKEGDSFCWSGYYHGVMEGIVGAVGPENLPSKLNSICASIPGKEKYNFDYYNCVHGLGHGLMAVTGDELYEALDLCDKLDGNWEKSSCAGGVFMENVIIDNKNHFTKYLKPEDPIYPCNAVSDKWKRDCFSMQTSYMLKLTTGDFKKVFAHCRAVEDPYKPVCFESLGRDASGQSVSDIERTLTTCGLGESFEEHSGCLQGAVKDFISYFRSIKEADDLCAAAPSDLKSICASTAHNYYRSFISTSEERVGE